MKKIFSLLLFIFFATAVYSSDYHRLKFDKLEIANNDLDRSLGLMFRREICDECALLFVFEKEQPLNFWMKNTYLPLDLVYLASDGKITNMFVNLIPLKEDLFYTSSIGAMYAIEFKAGYIDRHKLRVGDTIDLEYLKKQGVSYVFRQI